LPGIQQALETLRRIQGGAATPTPAETLPVLDAASFEVGVENLAPLSGEWRAIEVVRDGTPLPAQMVQAGKRVLERNRTTVSFGGHPVLDCLTRIDVTREPWTIDYLHISGPLAGQIQRAIARRVDDRAEFCMAGPGESRPTEFEVIAGSGWTYSAWRRT
jgi:uncharacterized protein (TIGR03067 family)